MQYLIIRDYLGEHRRVGGLWTALILGASLAIYLVISPHFAKGWKKIAYRIAGSIMVVVVGVSACTLLLGSLLGSAPREHTVITSSSGSRVALLSHSSFREFSTTQVAVEMNGCCSRYIAYDYEGYGDDYMRPKSVNWIDDHKLIISYAVDTSGMQSCQAEVGDVNVVCDVRPAPNFDRDAPKQP